MIPTLFDALHLGSHLGALVLAVIAGHLTGPVPAFTLHLFGGELTLGPIPVSFHRRGQSVAVLPP